MKDSLILGLCRALKSALIASLVWTSFLSTVFWFFAQPSLPFLEIVQILGPRAIMLFGVASLIFEYLTQSLEKELETKKSQTNGLQTKRA